MAASRDRKVADAGENMPVKIPRKRFEELVEDALRQIPEEIWKCVDNLVVSVEEENSDEADLLGLYDGIPLTDRGDYSGMIMPDRIYIYRKPICALSELEEEVIEQIRITVVHEVAHHFGIEDERLEELGYD